MALKEYTYYYEDGTLIRAAEYNVTFDENEFVTARTLISSIAYVYEDGKLIRKHIRPENSAEQIIYYENSDDNNVVTKFKVGDTTVTSHSKTDSFGRKVFDELQFGKGVVSRNFTYHVGEVTSEHENSSKVKSSPTTQLVKEITFPDGSSLTYEYDNEERITSVIHKYKDSDGEDVTDTTTYTYDALGQLLTETVNGTVVNTMTYDNYGNILTKNGVTYTYDSVWKDKLTAYGDQEISYDAQGNPTSYFGETLTWEKGRQLKTFGPRTFGNDANGIRTFKDAQDGYHQYTLEGTKIVKDEWEGFTLVPLYDNEDSACGIIFDNNSYFFYKNLQGDVIAIADSNGDIVARYSYDAWGVPKVLEDTSGVSVAAFNPFRYRGYYYDIGTGLYYLQSRYYDPKTGRFINGDEPVYLGSTGASLGYNLFGYCENNSTYRKDNNGHYWVTLIVLGVTLVYLGNNLVHNLYNQSKSPKGFICNQSKGNVANLRFGFFKTSYNGCGWIATYNALIMLGKKPKAEEIISEYEMTGAILYSVFGIQPYAITHYFRFRKYKVTVTYSSKNFDSIAKKNTANIIWYWHKSGAHYVALKWDGKKFVGYNTYVDSSGADNWGKSISTKLKSRGWKATLLISISKK